MCTVVCRWQPGEPVRMLALRDEFADRPFDEPDYWWPRQPSVLGGRDRQAGGSWCVTDVARGVTAVVLNRPERAQAEPGGASRGMLPLRAVEAGADWAGTIDVPPMAGFNLVLAGPSGLRWWWYPGDELASETLTPGTYLFTPRGLGDASAFRGDDWLAVLARTPVSEQGLLVRRDVEGRRYETVFGQLFTSTPGRLELAYLTRPADGTDRAWKRHEFLVSEG